MNINQVGRTEIPWWAIKLVVGLEHSVKLMDYSPATCAAVMPRSLAPFLCTFPAGGFHFSVTAAKLSKLGQDHAHNYDRWLRRQQAVAVARTYNLLGAKTIGETFFVRPYWKKKSPDKITGAKPAENMAGICFIARRSWFHYETVRNSNLALIL